MEISVFLVLGGMRAWISAVARNRVCLFVRWPRYMYLQWWDLGTTQLCLTDKNVVPHGFSDFIIGILGLPIPDNGNLNFFLRSMKRSPPDNFQLINSV